MNCKRITGFRNLSLATAALALIALGGPAHAQAPQLQRSFDTQNFEPAIGPNQLMTVENARVAQHLKWGVGGLFGYMNRPLSVYAVDPSNNLSETYPLVQDHGSIYLYGFFGFLKRFQVSMGLPIYLQSQNSRYEDLFTDLGVAEQPGIGGGAVGDLRIHFKAFIHSVNRQMFNIAASLLVTLPLSHWAAPTKDRFTGDRSATFWPRVIMDFRWRKLIVAANLGFLARAQPSRYLSSRVGHAFTFSTGGAYEVVKFGDWHFDVLTEFIGRNGLTTEIDETPLEWDLAVRFRSWNGVSVLVGGGAGLIKAVGSPKFRLFASVQYAPDFRDTDKDGVADHLDKCPNQKEDRDGFEDDDGCPDNDNDQDGIADKDDKCPNQKEDQDGFQDNDGCPDPDNDGDGVPDNRDHCPLKKGPIKSNGCPADQIDDDGDGITNDKDKCPDQEEDKDGFQDEDGCPDPDNDGDGIPDEHDKCKNDAEDKDGFQDGDGCPDPDNDNDGVCDDNPVIQKNLAKYRSICIGADKCPNKRETINGIKDDDGCPDTGPELVRFDGTQTNEYKGRFIPAKPFHFATEYGAELTDENKRVLRTLAHMMRALRQVFKRVAVIAHTDRTQAGDQGKTVTAAQANAIVKFLVAEGIPKERLVALGAGHQILLCKKRERKRRRRKRCQKKNRRVDFYLIERGP